MSKRRAVLVDEVPRKKPCGVPGAQPEPGEVGALHSAREEPVSVQLPKRRMSSSCTQEETVHEHRDREPPRKLTAHRTTDCDRNSGSFSALKCSSTCTEQHADTGTIARARTKVLLTENDDGDLGEYNSFQFWRNPLPALDLTLLDDPPAPGPSQKDTPEAMET